MTEKEQALSKPPYVQTAPGIHGQVDARAVPRYAGLATFARLPQLHEVDDYDIAVVGVPFDSGVTYRPGARFGPAAIRQASRLLKPYNPALDVSPFARARWSMPGNIPANPFDIEAAVTEIRTGVRGLITRPEQRVVLIGGDHTIALPALQAVTRCTARSRWCTSTPTWTPGTPTSGALHARNPVPPRLRAGPAGQGPLGTRRDPRLAL
jgi:agmatinase